MNLSFMMVKGKFYTTNAEGINLLFSIYKEKKLNKINSEDLVVTLE